MTSRVDEPALRASLDRIAATRAWPAPLIPRLAALIRDPDEFAACRVNPFHCAAVWATDPRETANLFLVAARDGLFSMHWDVLCTGCGDLVERFDSLSFLHATYHCSICQTDYDTSLDGSIEVSFSISPAVRDAAALHPERLTAEEYYYRWLLHPGGLVPDGRRYVDYIRPMVRLVRWLEPGERVTATFEVDAGVLTGFDGLRKSGFWVEVRDAPARAPQPLTFTLRDGGWESSADSLGPGPVALTLIHAGGNRGAPFLFHAPPGAAQHPTAYEPYLSARALFNLPLFRELFRGEVLGGSTGLKARDVTFLFTDLTGSTAMYERLGDVKAYALVHQHFDTLGAIIGRRGGAIVKTIGDAVMATFDAPSDAAIAATEMLQDIEAFNRARQSEDLLLKVGIHRGPCLAVTSNDRVDYFGQTVNLAARVQALAGPREICLTYEVRDADGVAGVLAGFRLSEETASVRGLEAPVRVVRAVAR